MGEAYITRRGGGAPLNFKVVGGTKPSNPKENTIWVSNPNLLDFNKWANNVDIWYGTKAVSGNSITLTARESYCHTSWQGESGIVQIPCVAGRTYILEWEHSGADGLVYLFPSGQADNLVMTSAYNRKLELTPADGVTFFTFRVGVSEANATATYSNIRITEKMAEITGWHFGTEEPNVYKLQNVIQSDGSADTRAHFAPHKLSEGEILNFVIPYTVTDLLEWLAIIDTFDSWQRYCIRNTDKTLPAIWEKGTKVSVRISNDETALDVHKFRTAYIVGWGTYTAEEGTVWIKTGTTSTAEMNVLKKNSIQVGPLNAKQYVGGAWALKNAETYQGGKWNDWAYWIIGNGADGSGITGGFTSAYDNQWSFADDGSLTFYKDIDNMYSSFNVPSQRTLDVTNYNSMTIKVSSFSRNASYIGVNAPSNLGKDSTCRVKISAAGTYTLDISAISGEVHLQADLDYNGVTMVVSELYFS